MKDKINELVRISNKYARLLEKVESDVQMTREDYSKYYIQGSDHYLIPKYEFKEIFREIEKLKDENRHLNMQLDRALEDLEKEQIKNERRLCS